MDILTQCIFQHQNKHNFILILIIIIIIIIIMEININILKKYQQQLHQIKNNINNNYKK